MKLDKEQVVLRRIKLMEDEGREVRLQHRGRQGLSRGTTCSRNSTPSSSAPARPSRAICRSKAASSRAFTSRWISSPPTPSRCSTSHKNGNFISAEGKDVIVIGGGDTGTDCVGTSMRHGCRSLVQFEILPKPPMDRAKRQPVARVAEGLQAGLRPGRSRRQIRRRPARLSHHRDEVRRRRQAATSRQSTPSRSSGRRTTRASSSPRTFPAPRKSLPAQLVLLAMGFLGPEQPLLDALGVERDPRSNVKAEHEKYTTSIPGVFAAGDCRRGQSLVVWAFNEGRGAARECDRYLMGARICRETSAVGRCIRHPVCGKPDQGVRLSESLWVHLMSDGRARAPRAQKVKAQPSKRARRGRLMGWVASKKNSSPEGAAHTRTNRSICHNSFRKSWFTSCSRQKTANA